METVESYSVSDEPEVDLVTGIEYGDGLPSFAYQVNWRTGLNYADIRRRWEDAYPGGSIETEREEYPLDPGLGILGDPYLMKARTGTVSLWWIDTGDISLKVEGKETDAFRQLFPRTLERDCPDRELESLTREIADEIEDRVEEEYSKLVDVS